MPRIGSPGRRDRLEAEPGPHGLVLVLLKGQLGGVGGEESKWGGRERERGERSGRLWGEVGCQEQRARGASVLVQVKRPGHALLWAILGTGSPLPTPLGNPVQLLWAAATL